jgi:outer membrane protein assembly factor BamB
VTPTGGGIVFFGDMGGNFYVVNASDGQRFWGQKLAGAIAGGVITYTANLPGHVGELGDPGGTVDPVIGPAYSDERLAEIASVGYCKLFA